MDFVSLFRIAVIPVIVLLVLVYKKDPHPESKKLLAGIFGLGCLSVIPVLLAEVGMAYVFGDESLLDGVGLFMYYLLGVGLVEEFFKWIVVKLLCFKNKQFEETYDAIVYSVFSSLGFACVENIMYTFTSGAGTGILRAFTSIPGHACFGIVMGYFFAMAKKKEADGQNSGLYQFLGLVAASLVHTIYDYLLVLSGTPSVSTFGTIGIMMIWVLFVLVLFAICIANVVSMSKRNVRVAPYTPQEIAAMQSAVSPAVNNAAKYMENTDVPMVFGVPMPSPDAVTTWRSDDKQQPSNSAPADSNTGKGEPVPYKNSAPTIPAGGQALSPMPTENKSNESSLSPIQNNNNKPEGSAL